jgi:hypothetical protein
MEWLDFITASSSSVHLSVGGNELRVCASRSSCGVAFDHVELPFTARKLIHADVLLRL